MRDVDANRALAQAGVVGASLAALALVATVAMAAEVGYSGGQIALSKTGSGEATVESTKTYQNNTGRKICDFVIDIAGGGSTTYVKEVHILDQPGGSNYTHFKHDDDGDNELAGGEDDYVNESPVNGKTSHSISDNTSNCIGTAAFFSVKVVVDTAESCTINIQATGESSDGGGHGGSQLAALYNPDSTTPSAVASLVSGGVLSGNVYGTNIDTDPMVSITFAPPTGVSITDVTSDENPGTWNSTTKTFTFTSSVPQANDFDVTFTLSEFDSGDITDVVWTAGY